MHKIRQVSKYLRNIPCTVIKFYPEYRNTYKNFLKSLKLVYLCFLWLGYNLFHLFLPGFLLFITCWWIDLGQKSAKMFLSHDFCCQQQPMFEKLATKFTQFCISEICSFCTLINQTETFSKNVKNPFREQSLQQSDPSLKSDIVETVSALILLETSVLYKLFTYLLTKLDVTNVTSNILSLKFRPSIRNHLQINHLNNQPPN